jgi:DMSO/TMAO reductase YedYZ molybdopterin-dependent catalytic subunit
MNVLQPSRRRLLLGAASLTGATLLSGCDKLVENDTIDQTVASTEAAFTKVAQRLILSRNQLAQEFTEADLSPVFKVNGTPHPTDDAYARLLDTQFKDWQLIVDGKVRNPLRLSLADLKRLPSRTQITRHDCVEGWSAIGKWTGVPLGLVLAAAGPTTDARFAVFHCADTYEEAADGNGQYYESIDLIDAYHPQTILAYSMNGEDLTVGHGAPLRLRVERQLGYKHAKYVMRIELVDSFSQIGRGNGGFWEDRGYEWYAGI